MPLRAATTDWHDQAAAVLAEWRNASIQIVDPSDFTMPDGPYDVVTDTGGTKEFAVVWEGPARIIEQHLGSSAPGKTAWATQRSFHFDIALTPDLPFFRQGLRIKVLNGGRDHTLEALSYTVQPSVNSSHALQRTIYALTDVAEVPA